MASLDFTYLGDLNLDRNLTIPDADPVTIRRTITPTFDGTVDQSMTATTGRRMTITAIFDGAYNGSFTYAQKTAIKAMLNASTIVELRHHVGTWNVKVIEENIEFTRNRGANIADSQRMFGTIIVMTTD